MDRACFERKVSQRSEMSLFLLTSGRGRLRLDSTPTMRNAPTPFYRRRFLSLALLSGALPLAAAPVSAPQARRVLRVGPGQPLASLAQAARLAQAGDRIEVLAGDYRGDVAVWKRNELQLVALGGRVRLIGEGAAAEGKGIFVVRAEGMEISGFDFEDARARDTNGAAIRLETGSLTVRDCRFTRNETCILGSNDAKARLVVEGCEFSHGHRHKNFSHLLYVGRIASLKVSHSYFHHAEGGHLLKSRAADNEILYSRLTDELGGTASYELEFPNGGKARVLGNVLEQSAGTENRLMVSYGAEGYHWPVNELDLFHNTLINRHWMPVPLLHVREGGNARVRIVNNLIAGRGWISEDSLWQVQNNPRIAQDEIDAASGYALPPDSALRGRVASLFAQLQPTQQYQHPRQLQALKGPARNPGAIQQP